MLKQKQEWSEAIEIKQAQLAQLTEEKREELGVMEIAIRRQLSEAKLKEDQLFMKEEELK